MNTTYKRLSIKQLSEDDQPREKLLQKGRRSLSDAELLAILIGSGSRTETSVQLCQRILSDLKNDLSQLGKLEVSDLTRYNGIGAAKAIAIIAALEIGRRRKAETPKEMLQIMSSKMAYECFISHMEDIDHEEFWVLLLNRANVPIDIKMIGSGGVSVTLVDTKMVLKFAIDKLASSIIVAHNHPSGSLTPSDSDIVLTKRLVEACKAIDIPLIDHLIVTNNGFYSFNEQGHI